MKAPRYDRRAVEASVEDSNRNIMKPKAAVLRSLASPLALPEVIQQIAANNEAIVTSIAAALITFSSYFIRGFFTMQ